MAGSHVHALFHHGDSPLHRIQPQVKIVGAFAVIFAVVAAPREQLWAFGIYLAVLVGLAALGRLGPRFLLPRMLIEVPFVVVALSLPLFAGGERIEVLGMSLSRSGLWDAWNIVAKATLGLLTSVILAGTTPVAGILRGLDALRTPRVITAIMGFMIRYLDVVLGELRRMRVAMASRAYRPTWIGQVRPLAQSAGTLFIRSYERGERVYLAMASRGYTGVMPRQPTDRAPAFQWSYLALVAAISWATAIAARMVP